MRAGSVSLGVLNLSKDITFSSAMPNANYHVFFQPAGNLPVVMWATNKTDDGFTLNVSTGISGSVSYCAIEDY
jgi:hypothetical protein